jgi:hypothetical protein
MHRADIGFIGPLQKNMNPSSRRTSVPAKVYSMHSAEA